MHQKQPDIHDVLLGRTIKRITAEKTSDPVAIAIRFTDDSVYLLKPAVGGTFTDLFINTMHRAEPIKQVVIEQYDCTYSIMISSEHHDQAEILLHYTGNPLTQLVSASQEK